MKRRRHPQTADLQERRDKSGKLISYSIRVHRGRGADGRQLKPWTATFDVSPTWSEKTARKKAEAFAATFEKQCKKGLTSDGRRKFAEYCDYVIELKEQRGAKHSTVVRYRELTERIYPAIGHIKLNELRADHLNSLYTELSKTGSAKSRSWAHSKTDLAAAIREALEHEPLKWKALVHMLLITGARRGEVLGLKWDNVDFENSRVYICNSVLYSADVGIYESTPKTERSKRYIYLPAETMALLRAYRAWQIAERERLDGYYLDRGFVFAQDTGAPMHPDSVTDYLKKLSRRYGLPHLNPHAFRHTMASMLYYNGVDSVSISKRLGHAQVSTPQKKNPKLKPSVSGFNLEKEEQSGL